MNPVHEILERGVEEVIVRQHLEKELTAGKKLRVKFGIDPTAPEMHIGHLVPLRKLRAFQELGHVIVFIIGDFTAMIGDPSGRNELRKPLTREETKKNAEDYLNEAAKILDIKKAEVHFNSEWFDKIGMKGLYELMSKITVQRALERDDFQKRIKGDQEISLVEMVYPLLQGYDSVAIKADLEIGGTDQKFNLLMGRKVQRKYDQKEQDVMTLLLIEGTDGVRKMSKSYGNYVSLRDTPNDIFGKVMSIPDDLIIKYLRTLSDMPNDEVNRLEGLRSAHRTGFPAMEVKMGLARELTALCHSRVLAEKAEQEFKKVFQKRGVPSDIPEKKVDKADWKLVELIHSVGLAPSKSEARRLITQGGVKVDEKRVDDAETAIKLSQKPILIQVGKRKFLKVKSG